MALNARQQARKAWLEKALTGIESAVLGALTTGAESMSINGRSLSRYNPQDMESMRKRYTKELADLERLDAGLTTSKTVRVYL